MSKTSLSVALIILSMIVLTTGCTVPQPVSPSSPAPVPSPSPSPAPTPEPMPVNILHSEKPRITSPEVSESDSATLADSNSEFAFDLYKTLKEVDGNLFYSPYSISQALGMTYAGAHGETEKQMSDTLHFTLSQDHLHPAFNSLDIELNKR